jgi:hypothetical protein
MAGPAVDRRRWKVALCLLKAGLSDTQAGVVVLEAAQSCRERSVAKHVLAFCQLSQLWAVYSKMAARGELGLMKDMLRRLDSHCARDVVYAWGLYCQPVLQDKWSPGSLQTTNRALAQVDKVRMLVRLEAACRKSATIDRHCSVKDLREAWEAASKDVYDVDVPAMLTRMLADYLQRARREKDEYVSHRTLMLALLAAPALLCFDDLDDFQSVLRSFCKTFISDDVRRLLFSHAQEKNVSDVCALLFNMSVYDDQRLAAANIALTRGDWLVAIVMGQNLMTGEKVDATCLRLVSDPQGD